MLVLLVQFLSVLAIAPSSHILDLYMSPKNQPNGHNIAQLCCPRTRIGFLSEINVKTNIDSVYELGFSKDT